MRAEVRLRNIQNFYAHGFRSPWRIAFDSATGRLWCGDVDQDQHEEVNVLTKALAYAFRRKVVLAFFIPIAFIQLYSFQ